MVGNVYYTIKRYTEVYKPDTTTKTIFYKKNIKKQVQRLCRILNSRTLNLGVNLSIITTTNSFVINNNKIKKVLLVVCVVCNIHNISKTTK